MKKKFTLEFDKEPSLVFVHYGNKPNDFDVYQDGKLVKGIRNIDINADYESYTTHRIEYLTGFTKNKEEN